jgi:hypothetical protein
MIANACKIAHFEQSITQQTNKLPLLIAIVLCFLFTFI